jgi:hypothetical protein
MGNELNKMTAVEWLATYLKGITSLNCDEVIEQAKEMEKQQIMDSFGVGCQVESTRLIGYHEMSEQYYAEKYGKIFIDLVSDEESQVHEVVNKLKNKKIQGGNK